MKCTKCGYENIGTAKYCRQCGHPFDETERELAYNKTIWHKIDRVIEAKQFVTFEKFTGNTIVRILILAAILIYGLFLVMKNGSTLTVRSSSDYKVSCNKELNEYYIQTERDSFQLSVYLPRKTEKVILSSLDDSGNQTEQRDYTAEDQIILRTADNMHYTLEADYSDSSETITIFVLEQGENE